MVCQEILRGLVTLVVGLTVAGVGLWLYFKQKEYELVKQRYLEQCVDVVAAELESMMSVYRHNWTRTLQIVKDCRDMEELFDVQQLSKGFLEFNTFKFLQTANARMYVLTNSNTVWNVYQLAMAFASSANAKIVKEIPETIRVKLTTTIVSKSHADLANDFITELKDLDDKSHEFAHLQRALHVLASELERQKLSFKKVRQFSQRKNVSAAMSELALSFKDELASSVDAA